MGSGRYAPRALEEEKKGEETDSETRQNKRHTLNDVTRSKKKKDYRKSEKATGVNPLQGRADRHRPVDSCHGSSSRRLWREKERERVREARLTAGRLPPATPDGVIWEVYRLYSIHARRHANARPVRPTGWLAGPGRPPVLDVFSHSFLSGFLL